MPTISLPIQFVDSHMLTNSAEAVFKTCPRKFYYKYQLGLRKGETTEALRLGTVIHDARERFANGMILPDVISEIWLRYGAEPVPSYMTQDEFSTEAISAVAMFNGWVGKWQSAPDMQFITSELPFALPILNPDTSGSARNFVSAGKIDGIVKLADGRLAVYEMKTTGESIDPDSDYWRRLGIDHQITRYIVAARKLGYAVETVVYDVIRKPSIARKQVPLVDENGMKIVTDDQGNRIQNKNGSWKQSPDAAAGHKLNTRLETPDEFMDRLTQDIASRPDFYYARMEVPRTSAEIREFVGEQWQVQKAIADAARTDRWYRNTSSCLSPYRCEFLDVCRNMSGMQSDEIPLGFRRADRLHEELPEQLTNQSKGL